MVTLTHGSPGVAEAGLERGGITPLVERSLSSEVDPRLEAVPRGLPVGGRAAATSPPTAWRWSPRTAGTCSAPSGPGLTGAWFPRSERVYPAVYEPPHVTAPDLAGVVDALLALPRRMTGIDEHDTPLGPARTHTTEADGALRGTLVLGHGAGGGVSPPTWSR